MDQFLIEWLKAMNYIEVPAVALLGGALGFLLGMIYTIKKPRSFLASEIIDKK